MMDRSLRRHYPDQVLSTEVLMGIISARNLGHPLIDGLKLKEKAGNHPAFLLIFSFSELPAIP